MTNHARPRATALARQYSNPSTAWDARSIGQTSGGGTEHVAYQPRCCAWDLHLLPRLQGLANDLEKAARDCLCDAIFAGRTRGAQKICTGTVLELVSSHDRVGRHIQGEAP